MFDLAAFRAAFPEFGNIAVYPDAMVTMWASLATAQVNPYRWGSQTDLGIRLYVAHEIVLAGQNQKAANAGGAPGQVNGIANSKTVGSVSVGYDTASVVEKDAGYWNTTIYGRQFIRLARIFGSGAIQL